MRYFKPMLVLVALVVAMLVTVAPASAHNAHQDHRGACARSTESISKGVGDLRFNGVLGQFAADVGITGLNGSITKQMDNQLVIGVVKQATTTNNKGCNGHGGTFGAGKRTLFKGEHVTVKVPAKFGKSACTHPSRKCKQVAIVAHVVFPVSCWNENTGTIIIVIWVHKAHPKPKPKKPTPKKLVCGPNEVLINGACQAQNVTQNCKAGQIWNGQQCVTIQANCSTITVGSGSSQGDNCDTTIITIIVIPPCQSSCTSPTVLITSYPQLNLIPVGKNSGPLSITVNASEAGGSLTIDPGIGSVSTCDDTTPRSSVTFSLGAGNSTECYILYAPSDADQPPSMTVTYTATLGTASDVKTDNPKITYPTRP